MLRFAFGGCEVGDGLPVRLIAEAGSNHNGNFEHALRLIDVAREAGADVVKFQTFKASRMYPKTAGRSDYLRSARSIYEIIESMEMPEGWIPDLAAYCRDRGIDFMSTPFDERSADLLAPHVAAFKVASYELSHEPLLRYLARLGKPIVMSTGAHSMEEVARSLATIRGAGCSEVVLLQCTARYPAPLTAIHAAVIPTLREKFNVLVGLSDHSRDPVIAPVVATALGACIIEKHFTLSNRLPGPDHEFAVEPEELKNFVVSVRRAEAVIGKPGKEVLAEEMELHQFARRSIFTTRAIREGELLTMDNIAVLRCGKLAHGLPPSDYESLLGRRASRHLACDTAVTAADAM